MTSRHQKVNNDSLFPQNHHFIVSLEREVFWFTVSRIHVNVSTVAPSFQSNATNLVVVCRAPEKSAVSGDLNAHEHGEFSGRHCRIVLIRS